MFENCSSGAMRADFAMLELFDLQSTSDQQDFRLYPAIAAGAPVQMLPEQAGNWAYPQAWMSDEEIVFTMVTGLSGRLYLSGFLDRIAPAQLELVQGPPRSSRRSEATRLRPCQAGLWALPDWYADSFALMLAAPGRSLVYVWHRGGEDAELPLRLGAGIRAEHLVESYPRSLRAWRVTDGQDGAVVLLPGLVGPSGARIRDCAELVPFRAARVAGRVRQAPLISPGCAPRTPWLKAFGVPSLGHAERYTRRRAVPAVCCAWPTRGMTG